jgi:hypothetical protein
MRPRLRTPRPMDRHGRVSARRAIGWIAATSGFGDGTAGSRFRRRCAATVAQAEKDERVEVTPTAKLRSRTCANREAHIGERANARFYAGDWPDRCTKRESADWGAPEVAMKLLVWPFVSSLFPLEAEVWEHARAGSSGLSRRCEARPRRLSLASPQGEPPCRSESTRRRSPTKTST